MPLNLKKGMAEQKLYTTTFWLLCLSYGFFGGSFNMIIPELPSYLTSIGGGDYKGLIIALFTLTAGLSRPFSGKLTDTIGRRPVMYFGLIVTIICSLLYPILTTVGTFLFLRFVHGLSTGFSPTALSAYIADIVPVNRRGEAMGIVGVSINLGSSITPPLGSYIAQNFSLNTMFFAASLIGLVSFLLLIKLKETLPSPVPFHPRLLALKKNEIISKEGILPAMVCGLSYMGFGAVITITPDQCDFLGVSNRGLYFTTFTLCSVLSRLVAGKASDKWGRIIVMRIAIICLAISFVIFGYADSVFGLLLGAGCIGFSLGICIPAVLAWAVDLSPDDVRGKTFGTVFIALEFAIGFGALLGAYIYDNNPANFKYVFSVIGAICLLAYLFIRQPRGIINES